MGIPKELAQEVREFYARLIRQDIPVPITWAVEGIIKAHPDISGSDVEWYKRCTKGNVWDAVNAYVRSIKASEDDAGPSEQIELFPGYERLQVAYSVERGGIQTIVPVALLTDDEIKSKIEAHERAAKGHEKHADELRRFMDGRKAVA